MDLEALTDPLVFYTVATVVILVAASVLFAVIHLPGGFVPIRTWLVILPIALGTIWVGELVGSQLPWAVLVATVSVLGFQEFARITGLGREPLFVAVVSAAIVLQNVFAMANRYDVFMALPTWAILVLAFVPIVLNRTERMLQHLALAIVGVVFYGYFLAHLTYLAHLVAGARLPAVRPARDAVQRRARVRLRQDAGAPPVDADQPEQDGRGLAAGRGHHGRPDLRPGADRVPAACRRWGVLAAGLIVAIGGQVGDLTMANVKRNAGVKDFGTLLPGHGGLTDRLNSLMVTAPAFAHFMGYLFGGFPA